MVLFEKGFRFSDNLFQSESIENVQNFQWLSHDDLSNGGLFRKYLVKFFRRIYALSRGFKMTPLRQGVFLC